MSQIQKGTTYATGDSVSATNLNNHVDNAILLPGAITSQTSGTAAASDKVLVSKAGVLNQVTAASIAALSDTGGVFLRADGTVSVTAATQLTLGTTQQLAALNAVSKGHLDANFILKTGGTATSLTVASLAATSLTGTASNLTVTAAPTVALGVANKSYVDGVSVRAWVKFRADATADGAVTVLGSRNISSVVKNTYGDYTLNITSGIYTDSNFVGIVSMCYPSDNTWTSNQAASITTSYAGGLAFARIMWNPGSNYSNTYYVMFA